MILFPIQSMQTPASFYLYDIQTLLQYINKQCQPKLKQTNWFVTGHHKNRK